MFESREKTLIVAYGAISPDIIHLSKVNHWTHLHLTCFPTVILRKF